MSSTDNTATATFRYDYDYHKKCTHCGKRGFDIENCAYKKAEDEEKVLLLSPCEQCYKMGHIKKRCPLIPDSPTTKTIKYNLYIHGGVYQGKRYYEEDYQGANEYLQDQLNKKYALMTPEELKEHFEDMDD
jgi:hypothetical protein